LNFLEKKTIKKIPSQKNLSYNFLPFKKFSYRRNQNKGYKEIPVEEIKVFLSTGGMMIRAIKNKSSATKIKHNINYKILYIFHTRSTLRTSPSDPLKKPIYISILHSCLSLILNSPLLP